MSKFVFNELLEQYCNHPGNKCKPYHELDKEIQEGCRLFVFTQSLFEIGINLSEDQICKMLDILSPEQLKTLREECQRRNWF